MLHRNALMAGFILVLSTLACNALSSDEPSVSPSMSVTEQTIVTATDSPQQVTSIPQMNEYLEPANYDNICEYGQALIPAAAATGYDYDKQWRQIPVDADPMLPNSYAGVNSICGLDEFYIYTFFTTVELNDIFAFYREAFAKAGYEEVEPFPETLRVAFEEAKWRANGLTLRFTALDVDREDDERVYQGALQINITVDRREP